MKNIISAIFLFTLYINIFAQSDNFLERRYCEKITNKKISSQIIGCWKLIHRQDKNGNIIDNPVDTDYCFMKDGTFFMIKNEEYFEGTWIVNSCEKFNLLLKSRKPLMLSEELKYLKERGVPIPIKNISYLTIYNVSDNILIFSTYEDIDKEYHNEPEQKIFYKRNNNIDQLYFYDIEGSSKGIHKIDTLIYKCQ